jgi:hypothetical protein
MTKKFSGHTVFKQNIANFPLIPKFSKNTLNCSLIITIFPEKTKFCGGAKFWGGGAKAPLAPLFRRHWAGRGC